MPRFGLSWSRRLQSLMVDDRQRWGQVVAGGDSAAGVDVGVGDQRGERR